MSILPAVRHVVIEDAHGTKSVLDICRIILKDTAAYQQFGTRIKVILGQKGTMFFEETSFIFTEPVDALRSG